MLVLSRKAGESIMIGNDIKITILKVEGRNISVGCVAPMDVSVHREEIFNKINKKNDKWLNFNHFL